MTVEEPEFGGIFLTKGAHLVIPANSITLTAGPDGPSMSIEAVHVAREMCPIWLRIAYDHLIAADDAHSEVLRFVEEKDDVALGDALDRELAAGHAGNRRRCNCL